MPNVCVIAPGACASSLMKRCSVSIVSALLALGYLSPFAAAQTAGTTPHLRDQGSAKQLIVDGQPYLILGGELGNSSASSLEYMREQWPNLSELKLNTVLAPVYWELIEPKPGVYDFTLLESLVEDAREHRLRLVLLWFGSWKNSMSSYAPAWVKRDQARFSRAQRASGAGLEILSPFDTDNRNADAAAFAALMGHLRQIDGEQHTVIMIQVENEIGMIPEARDHSALANRAFASEIPRPLFKAIAEENNDAARAAWIANGRKRAGTWEEVFGASTQTDELFMAWHFARYVEHIAAAGKAAYPLPMFVNAALPRPNFAPGEYPSAGPLPHLMSVWRTAAPSIDFLAPDIYYPNFVEWLRKYDRPGNAVFIPEANRAGNAEAPANAFYAIGRHNALGFSPFSIDSIENPQQESLREAYGLLAQLAPLIAAHQGKGSMTGVRAPVEFDGTIDESTQLVQLGDYELHVSFIDPWTPRDKQNIDAHGGLIIQLAPEEYLIAGSGLTITFATERENVFAGIESIWEGQYVDGVWQPDRLLNGDQSHQGRHTRLPPDEFGVQRVRLYKYR